MKKINAQVKNFKNMFIALKKYIQKNKIKSLVIIMLAIAGLVVYTCSNGFLEALAEEEQGIPVNIMDVKKGNISNDIIYSSKITSKQCVPIVLKTSGEVKNVYVKIGDKVKKGQVLFTLDEKSLRNNYNALLAQYNSSNASAEAALLNYNSTMTGKSEASLMQSKSQRDSLELELNNMKNTYEASKQIYELGGMSKSEFDKIESGYKTLQMNFENADYSYNLLKDTTINETKQLAYTQYKQAVAARDAIKAQLDSASDLLADARCKSPIDGVVSDLNVSENNTLAAGVSPCTIVNMDELEINLSVSENIISELKVDDEVKISVSSIPDKTFKGKINALSPAASQTGLYPVVISISDEKSLIKPGMFAKVTFFTQRKKNVIVIPREALVRLGNETYVFVVGEENSAKKVNVKTGIDNGKSIEIISGLKEGMKLIISGQEYLVDNQKIKVVE